MRNIDIVLGLGFGDEGKGAAVASLCAFNPKNTIVVRFNGGHQVGHTVHHKDIHHAFSNFGSGSLVGTPTYWSEYCTVNPVAVIREGIALKEKGINPLVIYNANAMVTTPFDIIQNRNLDSKHNHGSVGVGFGTTIQRNEDHYHLYVRDLLYPAIRDAKLNLIIDYYKFVTPLNNLMQRNYDEFVDSCSKFIEMYEIVDSFKNLRAFDKDLVFEGAQGIMLDKQYGFFPHVTRSYTTSRNAMEFIENNGLSKSNIKTYYITRAYQTRHGNGPMTNTDLSLSYLDANPLETNVDSSYQGVFRKSVLDLDLLKYAISCDRLHNPDSKKTLVITCCDQINTGTDRIPVTLQGKELCLTPKQIGVILQIFQQITTDSDKGFLHY